MRSRSLTKAIALLSIAALGCSASRRAPPEVPAAAPAAAAPAGQPEGEAVHTEEDVRPSSKPTVAADAAPAPEGGGGLFGLFSSHKDTAKTPTVAQAAPPAPPPSPPPSAPPKADPAQQAAHDRELVIYTAIVHIAVYQVDQGVGAVEKISRDMGGHLAKKGDREITIRVPRARFEAALAAVDKVGDVLHRDIQAQDVTDEHVDLEIRIKSARAMQKRLSDLLEKSSVKEALEIEKELHRVTEELERLEGKLKLLRDKVAYSTLTVLFQPRGATIQVTRARLPFPWLTALGLPTLLTLSEEK